MKKAKGQILMKKNSKAVLFTAAYIVFTLIFMTAAMALAVIAQGDGALTYLENETKTPVSEIVENETCEADSFILMIDAGHGGEDGGAVGVDGTLEKELNLAVSENVADLALLFGVEYRMTRTDDSLLYGKYNELTNYTGRKKALDLKNRLRFSEEEAADVFLSIHMNKFTSPVYKGLQVYYSPNTDDSRVLAEALRNYNTAHLQKDNDREVKSATSSIYLLHRLQIPAVLVECGFISNPEECSLLKTAPYRASLSCTLIVPLLEYSVRCSN